MLHKRIHCLLSQSNFYGFTYMFEKVSFKDCYFWIPQNEIKKIQVLYKWTLWKYLQSQVNLYSPKEKTPWRKLHASAQSISSPFSPWAGSCHPFWISFLEDKLYECQVERFPGAIFMYDSILTLVPESVFLNRRASNVSCSKSKEWKIHLFEISQALSNRCLYGTRRF